MNEVSEVVGACTRKESSLGRHREWLEALPSTTDEPSEEEEDIIRTSPMLCSGETGRSRHFLHLVRETVQKNAKKVYASWYDINGKCPNRKQDARTFEQIWNNAGTIAYYLRFEWNVKKGQRVILCYDFGLHFFEVFFGCLRAGVVAVLVYPPAPPFLTSLPKLAKVVNDCGPALILTDTCIKRLRMCDKINIMSKSRNLWPHQVEYQVTDNLPTKSRLSFDEETAVEDLAFLQYTSGSTGDPKGVMVTFKALASNVKLIHHGYYQCYEADGGVPDEIVGFSWLPQYHDLGLIYAGIAPFAAGWRMHMMSPFTFIKNPILWIELMSRYKVQWSVAPDFSFGLVARRFQESQHAGAQHSLDLSGIRYLTTAAEPCRPSTRDAFNRVFSAYGLREHWYSSGYGLAENVVGVSYVHGMHLSSPRQEDLSKVYIACANRSKLHPSLILKIVDPETCDEVQGDATGELWIAGPTVAAGYYGRSELSEQTFKAQLASMPGVEFLRTGDLAFFQSGYMYICGRIKDLIIINGANHYPQDLEFSAQDASSAVRPGCVAAFASNEVEEGSSVEVVFEIRGRRAPEAEQVCAEVRSAIVQLIGVPVQRVVAIAERSIPKTTSGKIQRRATREALHNGKLKVVHSSCSVKERTIEEQVLLDAAAVANLPVGRLPSEVEQAVQTVECNPDLLESYFLQLRLQDVTGLSEAWAKATKSNEALRGMCMESLKALARKHPTMCQFAHALKENPHWIQRDDLGNLFTEVAHCTYVLQWVTTKMLENPEMMQAKQESDAAYEKSLLAERSGGVGIKAVPAELAALLRLEQPDALFGNRLSFFDWIKFRTVSASVDWIIKHIETKTADILPTDTDGSFLVLANILEAVWVDKANRLEDNAMVGTWLLRQAAETKVSVTGNMLGVHVNAVGWNEVYIAWNMALCSRLLVREHSRVWLASKLLLPCLLDPQPGDDCFIHPRAISLYLAAQQGVFNLESEAGSFSLPRPLLNERAARLFGRLNYDQLLRRGEIQTNMHLERGETVDSRFSLAKLDEWSGKNDTAVPSGGPDGIDHVAHARDFSSIINATLGANLSREDEDRSWEELGLSSMAAVEFQSQISDKLLVTLPPNFQEEYPTPKLLKDFVESQSRKRLPVLLPDLEGRMPEKSQLEWTMSDAYQVVGVMLLLLLIAFSFVPAYHFGKLLASIPRLNHSTGRLHWHWLPLTLPVWMLSFSLTVIVAKWVVIGRYKAQQISVPSVRFLQWWFIDRLVHVWEIWIGNLVLETPVIWLFYSLMGTQLHPLARIDAFIREFDLVEIGAFTKLQYGISCRRFSVWDSQKGLFLRFRPVRIGSGCKIQGLVGLGSSVCDGSHVDRLTAVPEGAQVPERTHIKGSPAYNAGRMKQSGGDDGSFSVARQVVFSSIKILWLVFELYLFFAFLILGQLLLNGRLPQGFRYTPLLYWVLLLLFSSVLNVATCILFKWLLIGKKQPGQAPSSLYSEVADWVVDYHYKISLTVVDTIFMSSKFINIYLMALGMDIDLTSHVWAVTFPPSKVDLIFMRNTFVPVAHFDPNEESHYRPIKVTDSSLGHNARIKGGAEVASSQIAPFSTVDDKAEGEQKLMIAMPPSLTGEVLAVIMICIIFWSMLPAYELFQYDAGHPLKTGFSVTKFAAVLVVQTIIWLFLFGLLQRATLRLDDQSNEWTARNKGLYDVYLTVACSFFGQWSLFSLVWGTPLSSTYFKCLGSKVEGRMLHFTPSLYDFPLLTFADGTIVDRCTASGHTFTTAGLKFGCTRLAGTLHEMTLVLAHTDMTNTNESGPCRLAFQNAMPDEVPASEYVSVEQEHEEKSPGKLVLPFGGDDSSEVSC